MSHYSKQSQTFFRCENNTHVASNRFLQHLAYFLLYPLKIKLIRSSLCLALRTATLHEKFPVFTSNVNSFCFTLGKIVLFCFMLTVLCSRVWLLIENNEHKENCKNKTAGASLYVFHFSLPNSATFAPPVGFIFTTVHVLQREYALVQTLEAGGNNFSAVEPRTCE